MAKLLPPRPHPPAPHIHSSPFLNSFLKESWNVTHIWVIQLFNYLLNDPIKYQLCARTGTRALRNAETTHYKADLNIFSWHWRHWKRQTCTQVSYRVIRTVWKFGNIWAITEEMASHLFKTSGECDKIVTGHVQGWRQNLKNCPAHFFKIWAEGRQFCALKWCTSGMSEALSSGCFKLIQSM